MGAIQSDAPVIAESVAHARQRDVARDDLYLVSGFVRKPPQALGIPIPDDVLSVCTSFLRSGTEFDVFKKHRKITLSNFNQTATARGGTASVLCSTQLCADTMSAVHWELTVRKRFDNSYRGCTDMGMGYVDGDQYASARFDNYGTLLDNRRAHHQLLLWVRR